MLFMSSETELRVRKVFLLVCVGEYEFRKFFFSLQYLQLNVKS